MQMRRVVITGLGVIAPNGIGIDAFWDSLVHGRSGIKKITHFDASSYPCQVAGIVSNFDPLDYIDSKAAKRLSRFAQFAYGSAQMAVEDSGIDFSREDPYQMGVFVGTAIGGGDVIETQHSIFVEKGLKRISPYAAVAISTHSASGFIGCEFNLKGPNSTVSSACNTGLDATYFAHNAIRLGDADVIVVSTGESPITPCTQGVFCASGFLSKGNQDPARALKPFDLNSDGMVLGEGGASIVIEELHHALKRNSKIYGEIVSYSASNEAYDLFGIRTNSETMVHNFKRALNKEGLRIQDIDYINAHGNGLLPYDICETEAIKEVFGDRAYEIPVTSIKPITGHALSSTGIFQIISSLLSMKHGIIPPTINLENPAPECNLNYVAGHFQRKAIGTALINSHAFGGRMTALILRHHFCDSFGLRWND